MIIIAIVILFISSLISSIGAFVFKNELIYKKVIKKDSPGNDIIRHKGKLIEELKNLCNADPNCKAFNTDGWLKNKIDKPLKDWSGDFYEKNFSINGIF